MEVNKFIFDVKSPIGRVSLVSITKSNNLHSCEQLFNLGCDSHFSN